MRVRQVPRVPHDLERDKNARIDEYHLRLSAGPGEPAAHPAQETVLDSGWSRSSSEIWNARSRDWRALRRGSHRVM